MPSRDHRERPSSRRMPPTRPLPDLGPGVGVPVSCAQRANWSGSIIAAHVFPAAARSARPVSFHPSVRKFLADAASRLPPSEFYGLGIDQKWLGPLFGRPDRANDEGGGWQGPPFNFVPTPSRRSLSAVDPTKRGLRWRSVRLTGEAFCQGACLGCRSPATHSFYVRLYSVSTDKSAGKAQPGAWGSHPRSRPESPPCRH